ncbi:MAG TPA: CHAT domain-containing protein [Allosphingosinicella sp.]|jgi:tetratricopeptide (TPR) repeat protein
MAYGYIELRGSDIFCSAPQIGAEARIARADGLDCLSKWAAGYDKASERDDEVALLAIGREMFSWLDQSGWASDWSVAPGDRHLDIRAAGRGTDEEATLFDAPWELLANESGHLAQDSLQAFIVSRRIGLEQEHWTPQHGDLQLMFMAASLDEEAGLAFEEEEAAILKVTRGRRTHVIVEETGALEPLGERLTSDEGPFEALHLSCHGTIDPDKGPILLLETLEGDPEFVSPGDLVAAFGPTAPPLVVLSACRTAERGPAAPFARQLATRVPNVVGWDGSVYDTDATVFAAHFYDELENRSSVPRAAAHARRELLRMQADDPNGGRHWHLPRVYLGEGGGGPLCEAKKPLRQPPADVTPIAFLDHARGRVPVASRAAFVGRRRALQAILRGLRGGAAGVLVHGMGAVGKSSAAARIGNRLSLPTCVIFESYDSLTIFDSVLDMLPALNRAEQRVAWREAVVADDRTLADALESWLRGPFNASPILLVVDDLERILEPPAPGEILTRVMGEYRSGLSAVLKAFARSQTHSRLLLTSRYDFTLRDERGRDLAQPLVRQHLVPMPPAEREKQLRAAERILGRDATPREPRVQAIMEQALAAAGGNPGLQEALTRPILAGELNVAEKALEQIRHFRETGTPPAEIQALIDSGAAKDSGDAVIAFLARISLQSYRDALTQNELLQLSVGSLFSEGTPIPQAALARAATAVGCTTATRAIERLLGLGLLDDWGTIANDKCIGANTLARPLAPPLDEETARRAAKVAMEALSTSWRRPNGEFPLDWRGVEAARTAIIGPCEPEILEPAVGAGVVCLRLRENFRAALALFMAGLAEFSEEFAFSPRFLGHGFECADYLGETQILEVLLTLPTRNSDPDDPDSVIEEAAFRFLRARRLIEDGKLEEAETLAQSVISALEPIRTDVADQNKATAWGLMASIAYMRGEFEQSIELRKEKELPVYIRIEDWPNYAITMGEIGDAYHRLKQYSEALRIHRDEELPIYERYGRARETATALHKMALLMIAQGQLKDQSLEIGKYLARAFNIAQMQGLPDGICIAGVDYADFLAAGGNAEEAIQVLNEAESACAKIKVNQKTKIGEIRSFIAKGKGG